jgi:hypothetical protein
VSDFLANLVARTLSASPSVRPRLPSRYETASPGTESGALEVVRETFSPTTAPSTPGQPSTTPRTVREFGCALEHSPAPASPGEASSVAEPNTGFNAPGRSAVVPAPSPEPVIAAADVPSAPSRRKPVADLDSIPSPAAAASPSIRRVANVVTPRPPAAHTVRPRAMPVAGEPDRPAVTARSDPPSAASALPPPAPVQVTIGRVEIRAVVTPSRAERPALPAGQSLDAYLRRRAGASRS